MLSMFGAILLIATFVAGITVGTIITQSQFDQIDFMEKSLNITVDNKEKNEDYVKITFAYDYFEKLESGEWEVVKQIGAVYYPLEEYYNCRINGSTKQVCVEEAKADLKAQVKDIKFELRDSLESQKTKTFYDELSTSDFDLTDEELNED